MRRIVVAVRRTLLCERILGGWYCAIPDRKFGGQEFADIRRINGFSLDETVTAWFQLVTYRMNYQKLRNRRRQGTIQGRGSVEWDVSAAAAKRCLDRFQGRFTRERIKAPALSESFHQMTSVRRRLAAGLISRLPRCPCCLPNTFQQRTDKMTQQQ